MSVAFRRESDEEHKEPTFELPIPPGSNPVTARGLALIEAKVAELEASIADAGDDAARESLRRDLRYWHTRRATAEVVNAPDDGGAGIGTRVTFRLGGKTRTITIVGGDEADPSGGLIGFQAPLARALIGTCVGDEVDFNGVPGAIVIENVALA